MLTPLRHFRLRPYVFLVKGASRAALYDLHRRRIFPIPSAAGYVIERCATLQVHEVLEAIEAPEDRATAQEYIETLEDLDFGRMHDGVATWLPFNHTLAAHKWEQVLWLSVDLRPLEPQEGPEPDWASLFQECRRNRGCRQLTVFVSGTTDAEALEQAVIAQAVPLAFHHLEVVFPSDQVSEAWEALAQEHHLRIALTAPARNESPVFRRLQRRGIGVRFCEAATPALITERNLVCDHDAFRRLRHASVHCNSLHICANGDIYPWAHEKAHRIGKALDGLSLADLVKSPECRSVWGFTKDRVAQCRECEFRYACPQSYSHRKDPATVGSAPVNCTYDPYKAEWSLPRGMGLFDPEQLESRLKHQSQFFDIYSDSTRPFPQEYADLLDTMVSEAVARFGLNLPQERIAYYFYPTLETLQQEVRLRHGMNVCGLTELSSPGRVAQTTIRSAYPGHVHEVLHGLFLAMNPDPRFFVSESCATLLGKAWGSAEDLQNGSQSMHQGEVRITDADGQEISIHQSLVYDDLGILMGPLRGNTNIHEVARYLVHERGVVPLLRAWFNAADEKALPGYFYELGASFFLHLMDSRGLKLFQEFYQSKQTLRHLEGYYQASVEALADHWLAFLADREGTVVS